MYTSVYYVQCAYLLQVTASNLVGLDSEAKTVEGEGSPETTASCIHISIHKMRPGTKVVMHTHQPYVTALGEPL